MKQEKGKKSLLWLWIVLGLVAALIITGAALVGFGVIDLGSLFGNSETQEDVPTSEVYWNIDRVKFTQDSETGLSTRNKGEDGLYHIRFASQGQLMDLATADKLLVNYIDTMDVCGLVLDVDGLIIDVMDVKTFAVETAKNFYVKKVDGNMVTINSSIAMNGLDINFELKDSNYVMDVRPDTETLGQTIPLEVMDVVCVYGTEEEPAKSIYMMERSETSPLYLRVDRMYDSATASTSRVPDENGVYTIPFAINGKVEQLKCKDKAIVTGIDVGTDAKQVMGLTFDEEGYIDGTITAATAIRGKLVCVVYHVTAINDNNIEATRIMSSSEQGKVVNFKLIDETQIIMNEDGCGHFIGERVPDLQMNDRVVVWANMDNEAMYIKIDRRQVHDAVMYYNFARQYDSNLQETKRQPVNGYYVFELASKGKVVTVKTKDKEIANKIDGDAYSFFALKVEKGIVKAYYSRDCLTGGYTIGGQQFVTQAMASIVRIVPGSNFQSGGNYMLTPNTEIYDMTQDYGTKVGTKTTLREGDRVVAARSVTNEITHIYVVDHYYSGCKFYYNITRKYDSVKMETTRPLTTVGDKKYYVYDMYCEGKLVQVKVPENDKALASAIDEQSAPIVAMKVSGGIVKKAYPANAGQKYTQKVFNYNYVENISSDKIVSCYYFPNGVRTLASSEYKMAEDCKIYNVSTVYKNYRGEKTSSLKVGDRIQALRDAQTGELTHIWIMEREVDSPLFMHKERMYNSSTLETTRIPDQEGYYHVELFADGQFKTYKTKDKAIMSEVDAYGSETFFCLKLKNGNIIERTAPQTACKRARYTVASSFDIMKISGKTVTAEYMRPGNSNTGTEKVFTYTSKTKIYDVSYYSEHRWESVKLKKGDRIVACADNNGNLSYIFVMYPMLHENGPISKCTHCNKKVWWEPFTGSFINTAGDEVVHYYQPTTYVRAGQGTVGRDQNTYPETPSYTAVFDMNGKTLTSKQRNFQVYAKLVVVDTVGGGVLEATGYNSGDGGNFLVRGGEVTVQDGVILRAAPADLNPSAGSGGNFHVSNFEVKNDKDKVIRTNKGKVTIKNATLEGWAGTGVGSNITMNSGTELNIKGGTIQGGTIELVEEAKMNWTGGKIESNLSLNGSTVALTGVPNFTGILLTSNEGKVDISKLSTEASITTLPFGVFTTESDNIDAYLNVFTPAVDYCKIVKVGKALSGEVEMDSDFAADLQFIPGTQMAPCPRCEAIMTWKPVTQAEYGEKSFGIAGDGTHVYLAEDILYTSDTATFMTAPSLKNFDTNEPGNACFHLNGHNITAPNINVAHGSYGNLHIMGTGVVSGNGASGATVTINTNKFTGGMFLHSGTFTKAAGNNTGVLQINNGGGRIYVGPQAKVVVPEDEKAIYCGSANNIPNELIIMGTVEGGYVEMIDANPDKGNIATLVLDGGSLMGGAKLAKTNIIGLRGAAKAGAMGLDLTSGAKIAASLLTDGANVVVSANGIFTEKLDNVEEQKAFYAPERKYYPIEVREGALWTDRDPSAPNFAKEPRVPDLPELLSVDNSNLALDANNQAKCPVCDEVVTWNAITDTSDVQLLEGGMHYYLSGDLTYEVMGEPYIQALQATPACLHLNGHNITTTKSMTILVKGILNIMGNGTVSGNGYMPEYLPNRPDLQAATMQTNAAGAVLNVYGGTYVKDPTNDAKTQIVDGVEKDMSSHIIGIHGGGGTLNLFEGATFDGTGTKKNVLRGFWGMFNMYGGFIQGASNTAVSVGNWNTGMSGSGSIYGGIIQAGSGAALSGGGVATAKSKLNLYGGEVRGTTITNVNTDVVVAGTPNVSRLNIPTDGKITLGKLTEGADITVSSNGVFTYQCENVETYKQYFKGVSGYVVEVEDYALTTKRGSDPVEPEEPDVPDVPDVPETEPTVPALPELLSVDNTALTLDAEGKAKCPVCNEVVVWEAITDVGDGLTMIGEKHYYLANDIVYQGNDTALSYPYSTDYARKTACLHLNEHNITASKGIAIFAGNYLNIMGNGTVAGNAPYEKRGVTLDINSAVARVNLYGGIYKKVDNSNNYSVVGLNNSGGTLNVFDPVVIDGRDSKGDVVRNYNGNINVYGGTIYGGNSGACVLAGTGATGGNTVNGTVSIYGGLIKAHNFSGAAVSKGSTLNIYGGEVYGGTAVVVGSTVIVAGNPIMNRLVVNEGAKFTIGAMAEGASVTIRANGVFTHPNPNAAAYLEAGYFKPFAGFKPITVVDNALFTQEEGADEPDAPEVPEEPEVPEVPTIDNADLVFAEGTTKAKCPVCNVEVEWIAVTQETNGITAIGELSESGKHYYLAEDVIYAPEAGEDGKYPLFLRAPDTDKTVCFHLNGHNLTSKNARVFMGYAGVLNILGNGVVSSDYAKANEGAVLGMNTNGEKGVVNVYGGTFVTMSDTAAAFSIHSDAGKFVVGSEVKVVAPWGNDAIYVSDAATESAELVLDGCIVDGDITIAQSAANVTFNGASANIVKLAKNVTFTVSGDAHIEKLDLATGAKIAIGELASSAKINVRGSGVISEENANLNTYFGNFTSTYGCELSVNGNVLVAKDLNKVNNAALELDAESKAKCPVCDTMVTWTAITEVTASMELDVEGHYYLANDIEYTGTSVAIKYSYTTSQNARKSTCLHLNGHNLTATRSHALFAGNYLNVMGEGTVSGNESIDTYGATVNVNSSVGRLNLFGGKYVKAVENTKNPIAMVRLSGGTINVYNGAVVDATGLTTEAKPGCFVISGKVAAEGVNPIAGKLNVYGGEIKNGTNNTGKGGNIALIVNAEFNMYGGTISGGKAPAEHGGNIYSDAGPLNIMGGTISDGLARIGGNVATSNQPMTIKNAVIKNGVADLTSTGSASHGGNVSVDGSTVYISTNAQILDGKAPEGHAGNVHCYNTVLTMDGGIVSGGTSKNNNGNIWIYSETDVLNAYLLGGLSITASGEGITAKGNGLDVSKNITASVDGWFSVIDPEGAAFSGVSVGSTGASIATAATWFGILPAWA